MHTHFFFELGMLKLIRRSGSFLVGIKNPDSVAEHIAISAQIAIYLAIQENANVERCACMVIIHDNAECRIGDLNRVQCRYINNKKAIEKNAFLEQIRSLPPIMQQYYESLFEEFEHGKTIEAQCAKDADYLEMALQAKMHIDQGIVAMQDWMKNVEKALQTKSAKALYIEISTTHSVQWWEGLKKE